MRTIYVVTEGEYSDYGIKALFSTRELAQEYMERACNSREYPKIEEWGLDEDAGKVRRTVYRCEMPGGKCWTFELVGLPERRTPEKHITDLGDKFWADSYVDESHARKLAFEEQQRRLREG